MTAAQSGFNTLCPTSAADYPFLTVKDENGDKVIIRFHDSANATCDSGEPAATDVVYVDYNGLHGSSAIAQEVISAMSGHSLALTVSHDGSNGVQFTLDGIGAPSTAELDEGNGFLNTDGNQPCSQSSLSSFSGTPNGTGTEDIEFDNPSTYYSELEKINDVADLPSLTIVDHLGELKFTNLKLQLEVTLLLRIQRLSRYRILTEQVTLPAHLGQK